MVSLSMTPGHRKRVIIEQLINDLTSRLMKPIGHVNLDLTSRVDPLIPKPRVHEGIGIRNVLMTEDVAID